MAEKEILDKPVSIRSSSDNATITVKLPFTKSKANGKETGVKRRQAKALKQANRKIAKLTDEVRKLKQNKKKLQKRLERKSNRIDDINSTSVSIDQGEIMASTPRSKTKSMLKKQEYLSV